MRRLGLPFLLIPAVLVAAVGLAAYSYVYSSELSSRERHVILDTMRELAEEKVIGIETEIIRTDTALFKGVDIDNLLKFQEFLKKEKPAIESAVILDDQFRIIPGGLFSRRTGTAEQDRFRKLLVTKVIPDLHLERAQLGVRGHLQATYGGRPYLFSYTRRFEKGRTFYVVLEADLSYLVGTVFPQFFDVRSPRLYQVVDQNGNVIYGYAFTGIPAADVVELPFPDTFNQWRLRVAQRSAGSGSARGDSQVVDLVLIGLALAVIVAGLGVLVLAVRREQRANQLKSDFISNVSHELKTPLSIISMFGEMLALGRTKSPEQATEYAEIIQRESVRLARLIDNVLDFAKIERGVNAYEFADADVAEVLERALELSRRRLDSAGMSLDVNIEPDLPTVSVDANALVLVVLNLVDNAIKYASDGKRLEIALRAVEGGVELVVRDFGPGIPAAEQEQIFERFYRARAVRLKPIRGSGIGLALVKHIAEAHHGRVVVDSEPGHGTRFGIWIPARSAG